MQNSVSRFLKKIIFFDSIVMSALPLILFVAFNLYQLLYLNIEGNGKIACVVSLLIFWGLLVAQILAEMLGHFRNKANLEEDKG